MLIVTLNCGFKETLIFNLNIKVTLRLYKSIVNLKTLKLVYILRKVDELR